ELETSPLDAVIVTGSPPCAEWLTMEPLWHSLSGIVDVVRARGLPAIWSCLAAQVAIFRLDGVHRRLLPRKISGLHHCRLVEACHPLMAGLPRQWIVPHSRCNDLPVNELETLGYQPIVVSDTAGADTYIRERESLFVFFQGHLEYDRETLLMEYKRDIGKFLAGERQDYPDAPTNYFDPEAEDKILRFRERALRHQIPALMSEFPGVGYADTGPPEWSGVATRIYANWLHHIVRDSWLNPLSHMGAPRSTLSAAMGDRTAEGALP
ncbi:MAG: homoserine O-acetyltransferase/O-succinyltransferase family protein, partial [Acetobacteraceae bacterium]